MGADLQVKPKGKKGDKKPRQRGRESIQPEPKSVLAEMGHGGRLDTPPSQQGRRRLRQAAVLQMQRTHGNAYVLRHLLRSRSSTLQRASNGNEKEDDLIREEDLSADLTEDTEELPQEAQVTEQATGAAAESEEDELSEDREDIPQEEQATKQAAAGATESDEDTQSEGTESSTQEVPATEQTAGITAEPDDLTGKLEAISKDGSAGAGPVAEAADDGEQKQQEGEAAASEDGSTRDGAGGIAEDKETREDGDTVQTPTSPAGEGPITGQDGAGPSAGGEGSPMEALGGAGGSGEALKSEFDRVAGDGQAAKPAAPQRSAPPPVPTVGRGEIDSKLQELSNQVATQKAGISAAVAEAQLRLIAEGVTMKAAFAAQITAKRGAITGLFEAKSAELEGQRVAKKQEIEARRQARKSEVDQKYQAQSTALFQTYARRHGEAIRSGQSRAGQMIARTGQILSQVNKSAGASVNRALNIGEWKVKYYRNKKKGAEISKMARKMAAQTASQIATGGSKTAASISKDGRNLAKDIRKMATKAAAKFAQGLIKAHQALGKAREKAKKAIDKAADAALPKIDPVINKGKASLLKIKRSLLGFLKIIGTGYPASVDISVAKGQEALKIAGKHRQAELDQGIGDVAGVAQGMVGAGEPEVQETFEAIRAEFTAAGEDSANEIRTGSEKLKARLAQSHAMATAGLDKLLSLVTTELSKFVGGVNKGLSDLVQKADQGMGQATAKAHSVMTSIVTKYDSALGQAVAKTKDELDKAVAEGTKGLLKKAGKALAPMAQLLGGLGKRIDVKAKDMQRHWLKRVGLAIVGFLAGFVYAGLKILGMLLGVFIGIKILLAVLAFVFAFLISWLGAVVGVIVVAILIIVIAIAAVAALLYFLYKGIEAIVHKIISAATDDTLTSFERGSLAGEATADIAAMVLPFSPKVRGRVDKAIKWAGSKFPRTIGRLVGPPGKTPASTGEAPTRPPGEARTLTPGEAPTLPPGQRPRVRGPAEAGTLTPGEAPTLPPGQRPRVRGPAEAPTLRPGEGPTLPPGEAPRVRGPAEAPTVPAGEAPTVPAPARPGARAPRRTRSLAGRQPIPRRPSIRHQITDKVDAQAFRERWILSNRPYVESYNPRSFLREWRAYGGTGDPPMAYLASNGTLFIDVSKVGHISARRFLNLLLMRRRGGVPRGPGRPPPGGTTQPPPSSTAQPPLPTTRPPPRVGTTQPPPSGTTQPHLPTTRPPRAGTTQPPPSGTTQPPLPANRPPPRVGTTQPPPSGTTQPPLPTNRPPRRAGPRTGQPAAGRFRVQQNITSKADARALRERWMVEGRPHHNINDPQLFRQEWRAYGGTGDPPYAYITTDGRLFINLKRVGQMSEREAARIEALIQGGGAPRGQGRPPPAGGGPPGQPPPGGPSQARLPTTQPLPSRTTTQPPLPASRQPGGTTQPTIPTTGPSGRATQPTIPTNRPRGGTEQVPGTTTQPLPRGGATAQIPQGGTAAGRPANLPRPKVTEEPGGWQGRWPKDQNARVLIDLKGDHLRVIDIYKGSQPKGAGGHMVADVIQAAVDKGMTIPGKIRISNLQPKPSQQAFQAGKPAANDPVFGGLIKIILRRLGIEAKSIKYVEDVGKLNIDIQL